MAALDSLRQRVGTTLRGKWTLVRLVGVGGMAAVYEAVHRKIGRREAIKILHPEVASSPEIAERFEREAHVANRFRHPGAVVVRDYDVAEDGAPFLVMELLAGESLGQRMARGPVPSDEALRYADELLDVLGAAHAQGVVHRDIKPDNLFITTEGALKVLDFGIARLLEGAPMSQHTGAGRALGTPHYMAPEQVLGGQIDGRADLYAAGAMLFRLAAGRHPYESASDLELFVKVATEPAPKLRGLAPEAPSGLEFVVDRALSLRPEDRYPDAPTMQGDIKALRLGLPPPFASGRSSKKMALFGRGTPATTPLPTSVDAGPTGAVSPASAATIANSAGAVAVASAVVDATIASRAGAVTIASRAGVVTIANPAGALAIAGPAGVATNTSPVGAPTAVGRPPSASAPAKLEADCREGRRAERPHRSRAALGLLATGGLFVLVGAIWLLEGALQGVGPGLPAAGLSAPTKSPARR